MTQPQLFIFDDKSTLIKTRHSFYETSESGSPSKSGTFSRSDVNIIKTNDFPSNIERGCVRKHGLFVKENSSDEYYKNYEHDEVPEKDSSCFSNNLLDRDTVALNTKELTNSDLEKLESRIFENMSKELETYKPSVDKYEYNIKLFKTTVQEILDKFYSNVQDFEIYKKRFHEILCKNKENLVDEMEEFVKEMIQNIVSSESSMSSEIHAKKLPSNEIGTEYTFKEQSRTSFLDTGACQQSTQKTVEAFKNENYLTDSTFDDENAKISHNEKKSCNIYLLTANPCIEIKVDGRSLLSETNVRNRSKEIDQIASADNVKSVAAKRIQMMKYMKHAERQSSDKVIPIRISYAKKNIQSEDCPNELDENNKSFIYKICNFLCKKLRKTSFG